MRDFLLYNAARIGLLVITTAIVWSTAGISLISTVIAVIIATLLSYLMLSNLRRRAGESLAHFLEQRRRRPVAPKPGSDEAIEDEIDERYR